MLAHAILLWRLRRDEREKLVLQEGALTQTAAPSVGVVTLFSALALNYYIKNGPTLSEVAQSCLDIKYGYSTPPPLPNLSSSSRAGTSEARDWCRRAWLSEVQGGPLPSGSEAEIKDLRNNGMYLVNC